MSDIEATQVQEKTLKIRNYCRVSGIAAGGRKFIQLQL